MRLFTSAACATVAVALLAGCSGTNFGSTSSSLPTATAQSRMHGPRFAPLNMVPAWMLPAGISRLHLNLRMAPAKTHKSLIYASNFYQSEMWGYPDPNSANGPATCTLGNASNYLKYINGFGVDTAGDVMVPAYTPNDDGYLSINVFAPKCGALLWQAEVDTGQPADAYSSNGATGSILVGELADYDNNDYGALVICSKASSCGTPFTNSAVTGYGAGVAMAKNGDCWLSAATSTNSGFVLVYFAGCTGTGEVATGTSNTYYGGLFIDGKGNLGSIDLSGTLYVYSGCNPKCSLVGSTKLEGEALFGGLDGTGKYLSLGDYENNAVDIYSYNSKTGTAKYLYSFTNGLTSGSENLVETAHFAPRNKKV